MHPLVFSSNKYSNNSRCQNNNNNNINISSSEKPGHWAWSRATVGGKGHTECHSGLCQSSLFLRKNTTCRQRCTLQHVCCIQHYITHNVTTSISSLSFGAPKKNDLVSIDIISFNFWAHKKGLGISWQVSYKKGKYFYSAGVGISLLFWVEYFSLKQAQRGSQYQSSPFFSVAFDTAPRRVPGQEPSYAWWWCQCDDESRCAIWARCQPILKSMLSLQIHALTFRSVIETNTPNDDRFIYGTALSRTRL